MLNQTIIVGRIANEPKLEEYDSKKVVYLNITVPRNYKNEEGIYESDTFPVTLWMGIAEKTAEYCKKGDLIGVKGRLEMKTDLVEADKIQIIAEKVTFLSNKQE